jgi:hypothetical protein
MLIFLGRSSPMHLCFHSQATWNLWLERAGLEITYPRHAVLFDDVAHTIRSALAGHGIAMARSHLVQDYLDSGRLIKLFDLEVPGLFSFFLRGARQQSRCDIPQLTCGSRLLSSTKLFNPIHLLPLESAFDGPRLLPFITL